MKVIKTGNRYGAIEMNDGAVPVVLDCDECGSQFEVTVSDCEKIGDEYYVDCPCCANRISVKHIDFYPHETPKFPADFSILMRTQHLLRTRQSINGLRTYKTE